MIFLICTRHNQFVLSRLSVIFLILSLSVPFTGAYTWLHWQIKMTRKEVKRNMIKGLDKSELVLLKFSKAETATQLRWEHSREFEYRQNMYDIVETEERGDSIWYLCWWDHAETQLKRQLADLADWSMHGDTRGQERQLRLDRFFKSLYLAKEAFLAPVLSGKRAAGIALRPVFYSSPFFSPLVPPPETA
jgi:hypothetical protein